MTSPVTAETLAVAVRQHGLDCTTWQAAMFLGYWLEHGIVTEDDGRFWLTDAGLELGNGLLSDDDLEERAA